MDNEKIRKEFGYEGKSKEYQRGFDALLRHLPSYILIEMQNERREARYRDMTDSDLRIQITIFSDELKDKRLPLREVQFKTNSIRKALMELSRRGLKVEPIIIARQKTKPGTHYFITHEIDMESIERNMTKLLTREDCPLCKAGVPRREVKQFP